LPDPARPVGSGVGVAEVEQRLRPRPRLYHAEYAPAGPLQRARIGNPKPASVQSRGRQGRLMSKLETPMIRAYWQKVGGTLIEEFPVVMGSATCGPRRLDAVILPKGDLRIARWTDVSLEDKEVIVIQAKARRLGMYLMGQAVFSVDLV